MRISDWSSDVCSSDLIVKQADPQHAEEGMDSAHDRVARGDPVLEILAVEAEHQDDSEHQSGAQNGVQISDKLVHGSSPILRSEERSVGNEGVSKCRSRGSPYH